jgi:hypothetical protein
MKKLGVGCLAVFGFFALIGLLSNGGLPESKPQADDELAAFRGACRILIQRELHAPTTASFPHSNEWSTTKLGPNKYRIRSWVEAKNAFGVPVRNNFDAVLKFDGVNYWEFESLEMD